MVNEFNTAETRVARVLAALADYLKAAGLDEAMLKAEHVMAHRLGCRRLELTQRGSELLEPTALEALRQDARRLADGEPLPYVLGSVNFMGHELATDYRALIPRPETEELVELVLACETLRQAAEPVIVDVGTGSGCIAIALALSWPPARILATDISAEALGLARHNAQRCGVADRIQFIRGDLLAEIADDSANAVVANLPYVRSSDWARLPREIREHEPRDALDGGKDGLVLISRLVPEAVRVLKSQGWLFLEIGEDQAPEVSELMRQAGFVEVYVRKDLSGLPRFVVGHKP